MLGRGQRRDQRFVSVHQSPNQVGTNSNFPPDTHWTLIFHNLFLQWFAKWEITKIIYNYSFESVIYTIRRLINCIDVFYQTKQNDSSFLTQKIKSWRYIEVYFCSLSLLLLTSIFIVQANKLFQAHPSD